MKKLLHEVLRKIYHSNKTIRYIWLKISWNRIRYKMKYKDEDFAYEYYYKRTGNTLNLSEPKTFDDKIWYLKLNNRDPLLTKCSDKYLAREYVKECGLEHILNELYGVYDNANEIDFTSLPSPCIIKCTHVSGINSIYNKNKAFDKKDFTRTFNYILQQNYYWMSREWNYKNIKPRIICERILENRDKSGLVDYRFLCFDGNVKYLFVDIDTCADDGTHNRHAKRNVYDSNFNLLEVKVTRERFNSNIVKKPINFNKMREYAEILSKPFPFCRVDFYNIDGEIYFGEMTFYHTGGCTNIEPTEWRYILGDCIDISKY